jgi:hypothetical protein
MTVTEYTVLTCTLIGMAYWLAEALTLMYANMFVLPFFK